MRRKTSHMPMRIKPTGKMYIPQPMICDMPRIMLAVSGLRWAEKRMSTVSNPTTAMIPPTTSSLRSGLRVSHQVGGAGSGCGGGGGVVSNQRAAPLRAGVFAMKRRQVDATGAKRLVTSCGQCRITLETGARIAKWDKPVESLLELVADNLAD